MVLINEENFIGSGYCLINKKFIDDVLIFENELRLAKAKNDIINLQENETTKESIDSLLNDINSKELKKLDDNLTYNFDFKSKKEYLKIDNCWYDKKFMDIFLKNCDINLYYKQTERGLLSFCNNDGVIICLVMSINR
jgi:hypothetical protein